MSKIAAIDIAMRLQMAVAGKALQNTRNLNVAGGYTTEIKSRDFVGIERIETR